MNLTPGGLFGYCSSKCITKRNVPSSNGVSVGPMMTAFLSLRKQTGCVKWYHGSYQVITLSAIGDAETPAGGSVCIRYVKSSISTVHSGAIKRDRR